MHNRLQNLREANGEQYAEIDENGSRASWHYEGEAEKGRMSEEERASSPKSRRAPWRHAENAHQPPGHGA